MAAEKKNLQLKFEAAVAGGIPIVKTLRESLVAYDVQAVKGILNGTCNYILTEMEATGASFASVLKEAQKLGYAEADPTLDVGGGDTAHKLALLVEPGVRRDARSLRHDGGGDRAHHARPTSILRRNSDSASSFWAWRGCTPTGIEQKVHPAMVRARSPLANVDGAANGVLVDAGQAGPFFFSGRGAGEAPTASAVVADLVEIARGSHTPVFGRPAAGAEAVQPGLRPMRR